jgi:hypothetical protein
MHFCNSSVLYMQTLLIYLHSNNINNMVKWKGMQLFMKALTSFSDKWNLVKNKTLSRYTFLLHNCLQLLFCCNTLLILHGKPQPNQFLPQSFLFTFRFTYFRICMVLQLACNKLCSFQTLSISHSNMSYTYKVCCFTHLPLFFTLCVKLCSCLSPIHI